jgi:hypothetical protein
MPLLAFNDDAFFGPVAVDAPSRYRQLAAWLSSGIGHDFKGCLDALELVDDALNGQAQTEEWGGEGWSVHFGTDALHLKHQHGDDPEAAYDLRQAREAIEDFWRFLTSLPERKIRRRFRPDLPEWQADLLQWEESWNRRHPYRGRLGIPESGPA